METYKKQDDEMEKALNISTYFSWASILNPYVHYGQRPDASSLYSQDYPASAFVLVGLRDVPDFNVLGAFIESCSIESSLILLPFCEIYNRHIQEICVIPIICPQTKLVVERKQIISLKFFLGDFDDEEQDFILIEVCKYDNPIRGKNPIQSLFGVLGMDQVYYPEQDQETSTLTLWSWDQTAQELIHSPFIYNQAQTENRSGFVLNCYMGYTLIGGFVDTISWPLLIKSTLKYNELQRKSFYDVGFRVSKYFNHNRQTRIEVFSEGFRIASIQIVDVNLPDDSWSFFPITTWWFLIQLRLYRTRVGEGLKYITQGEFPKLRTLEIDDCGLTAEATRHIPKLKAPLIEIIDLQYNQFGDAGVRNILKREWFFLKTLKLSRNKLTKATLREIGKANLPRLRNLQLRDNQLPPHSALQLLKWKRKAYLESSFGCRVIPYIFNDVHRQESRLHVRMW